MRNPELRRYRELDTLPDEDHQAALVLLDSLVERAQIDRDRPRGRQKVMTRKVWRNVAMHAHDIQLLVSKLKELPPERVAEVADFVDFLRSRSPAKRTAVTPPAPFDFPVISVGRWPEDLSLRREDVYGDDGR